MDGGLTEPVVEGTGFYSQFSAGPFNIEGVGVIWLCRVSVLAVRDLLPIRRKAHLMSPFPPPKGPTNLSQYRACDNRHNHHAR